MVTSGKEPPSSPQRVVLPTVSHRCRRQASIGLGVVTRLTAELPEAIVDITKEQKQKKRESFSKNDTFFDTDIYSQIKPPPSLIMSINKTNHCHGLNSVHHHHHHHQSDISGATPSPSFADRIRSIVLANRKTAAAVCNTPLSSMPPMNMPEPNIVVHTSESADDEEQPAMILPFPEEKIIRLPSPAPPIDDSKSETAKAEEEPPSSAIPVISLSPNLLPNKTNVIPSLEDVPMLGDNDQDDESVMVHLDKMSHSPTMTDDQLIGKHIWKYRIKQLLGIGAFSRVFLSENLEEGGNFAVKIINKKRMLENARVKSSIEREVGVLKVYIPINKMYIYN